MRPIRVVYRMVWWGGRVGSHLSRTSWQGRCQASPRALSAQAWAVSDLHTHTTQRLLKQVPPKSKSSVWTAPTGKERPHVPTKRVLCEPLITLQAEPNILPFDPGDSCHMDVLRWQQVDSLQFRSLFETVLALLLAHKQKREKNNYSIILIHSLHNYFPFILIQKSRHHRCWRICSL